MIKYIYIALLGLLLTGCTALLKNTGTAAVNWASKTQLEALDIELQRALTANPQAAKTYDSNVDGKLTWADFDLSGDDQLDPGEALTASKALSKIWGTTHLSSAAERISSGEPPAEVIKDEVSKWLNHVKTGGVAAVLLAFLGWLRWKLVGSKEIKKVVEKCMDAPKA